MKKKTFFFSIEDKCYFFYENYSYTNIEEYLQLMNKRSPNVSCKTCIFISFTLPCTDQWLEIHFDSIDIHTYIRLHALIYAYNIT